MLAIFSYLPSLVEMIFNFKTSDAGDFDLDGPLQFSHSLSPADLGHCHLGLGGPPLGSPRDNAHDMAYAVRFAEFLKTCVLSFLSGVP